MISDIGALFGSSLLDSRIYLTDLYLPNLNHKICRKLIIKYNYTMKVFLRLKF